MAEVVIRPDAEAASAVAAGVVTTLVQRKPTAVLGLATGSTPGILYRLLAEAVAGGLDMGGLRCFALDEYVGLPVDHPERYRSVLLREVVEPLHLDPSSLEVPDGDSEGLPTAGERYEAALRGAGGIDVQILGLGTDGHIGFNEPGSSLASRTRVKTLSPQTRRDNARFFTSEEEVPRLSVTQGIGTILEARHLVLLAFGSAKAAVVAAALEGPVTTSVPASALQLHPHVTVVLDDAAAAALERRDLHVEVERGKPAWQGY